MKRSSQAAVEAVAGVLLNCCALDGGCAMHKIGGCIATSTTGTTKDAATVSVAVDHGDDKNSINNDLTNTCKYTQSWVGDGKKTQNFFYVVIE